MPTPYLCQPVGHGADIVVHSMTKYIGGHGNSMGGVIVDGGTFDWFQSDKFPALTAPTKAYHGIQVRGDVRRLRLRHALQGGGSARHRPLPVAVRIPVADGGRDAAAHATPRRERAGGGEFLAGHPLVAWVSYPGLPASPHHALAKRYMSRGTGAVFTFGVKGGYQMGIKVVEGCELLSHLANIGDTR